MSLWPGIPLPMSDFSLADNATKINDAYNKVNGYGMVGTFGGIISGPTLQPNVMFRQAQQQIGQNNLVGMSGMPWPNTAIQSSVDVGNITTSDVIVTLYPAGSATQGIKFVTTPVITEGRQANWEALPIVHHPGEILAYKSTTARTWQISEFKLVSRTPKEAGDNLILLNKVRSWVMPFYGFGTEKTVKSKLGAPPPILILRAYGDGNIGPVPVVLTSYNFSYPNDVDMIPANFEGRRDADASGFPENGTPFPIIATLTLDLKEAYSPTEYSSFDIVAYRTGNLTKAFDKSNRPFGELPKTTTATEETTRTETATTDTHPQQTQHIEVNNTVAPSQFELEMGLRAPEE